MISHDPQKEALLDSIARKMKFLGTYHRFNESEMREKSLKQLEDFDFILGASVKAHSNPLLKKQFRAITRGKMDPRWEPFVHTLRQIAKSKPTFRRRRVFKALIKHLTTSSILLNYVNSMLVVSYESNSGEPDIELFHERLWSVFRRAKLEYLLRRAPMAFNYEEGFAAKALLQTCRSPDLLKDVNDDSYFNVTRESVERSKDDPLEEIKPPKMVDKIFGSEELYRASSLQDYGKRFFEIMHDQNFEVY